MKAIREGGEFTFYRARQQSNLRAVQSSEGEPVRRGCGMIAVSKRLSADLWPMIGFLITAVLSAAQPLVFTIRTHPTCPIETSMVAESKEFGFQSATFRNESPLFVESLNLKVEFGAGSKEEVIDSLRIRVHLQPGEERQFELQLGGLEQLNRKLRSSGEQFARVVLFVDSAEFSDGTEWQSEDPVIDVPVQPVREK